MQVMYTTSAKISGGMAGRARSNDPQIRLEREPARLATPDAQVIGFFCVAARWRRAGSKRGIPGSE
jgi:hypothetical protein